ncbi:MAG: permease-like cell division protein FtsX [Patescibacteria group bacterium]
MFLLSLGRSIIFALQSFWRNIWLSIATIFVVTLALLSINFLVGINAISESAVNLVKEKVDVSVYFKPSIKESKIAEVKSHLETIPQVKSIVYRSPEDNLAEFKSRHQDDQTITETLSEVEGNPLGATLIIKAKKLADYPEILQAVDNPAYAELIEEKSYDDHQTVISRINGLADSVKKGGLVVSIIFVIIAALIIFNTVRIAIFTHNTEIGVMKLVGASNWFVRSPFVIENVISGIIACIISTITIYIILFFAQPYIVNFFQGVDVNLISYFNIHFIAIFGLELLGIVLLNIVSSLLALGRYLKV